ncbi:MAG: WD40 repeat domain-containing protein, partial [Pirellulaceae bacterium]
GDLLRGLALGTAERWLKDRRSDLNTGEVGYITASTAAAKRRRITSVAALAAAFLAISAFAIFAGIQWRNASRSADDANIARGQALEGYEMAKEAQGEAERQTSIAVTARDEAQQQRAEAQRQTGIAVAARDEAEKQARLAEDQRKVALGRQLAADSELIRRQRAGLLELSTLLAVESLQHFRTLGGDLALRGALDLLPRPVATVDFGGPPLKISPDGRLVLTSVGSAQPPPAPTATTPEYQIRDAQTGRLISRLDAARSPSDPFFSQDGRLLFADMHSTTPHVWDTATGARVAGLPELADQRIVLSPDGRFMAATTSPWADLNATVFRTSVYDTTTWNRIAQLRHAHSVNTLTFSPDGKYLATANGVYIDEGHAESDVVRLWELARCQDGCQELAQLEHGGAVNRIAFAADGQRFATASSDRNIRIWERKPDGSVLQLRKQEYQRAVSNALLSADGRYFAGRTFVIGGQKGGDYSEPLSIYDVQDSQQVAYIVSDSPLIYADFAPDSPRLLTFSADGLTRLWEAEGGREVTRVGPQHEGPLPILSPDGTRLVTGDKEGHISTWEPRGGHERMWARHDQFAVAVAFSGDGKSLVSGSYDGTARVWDLATGKEVACIDHRGGACTNASEVAGGDDSGQVIAVAISPDSQLLATGSRGQNGRSYTARVRPLAGGSETVLPHTDNVNAVAFSPDGKRLATGSRDHQVRIWDIATGTEVLRLPHEGNVTAVAFHPDGRLLATAGGTALGGGTGDNTVRVWDLTTRQEVTPKVPAQSFWSVAFSPDGTSLAAASNDGMVRFWAVPGFQKLDLELRHESSVNTVVFSPDGKFVATAHANAASVWDLASGQEVSQVAYAAQGEAGRRLAGPVRTVAFGHDGRTLATAGEDGVRVWIAPTDDLITEACARLTRNLREPEWRTYLRDEVPRKTCPSLP